MAEPPRRDSGGESRSEIEGSRIHGDIVQARDVSGGVHFHTEQGSPGGRPVVPRELPADIGTFVNRQPELRALSRITKASAAMVIVVTGSAGVGKTALALHWAHRVRDRFAAGELYANMRGFDEGPSVNAEVVLDRFLRNLGVSPDAIPADLDGRAALFRSLSAGRNILIVLDNVADIGQVRPLIPGGPGPCLLVTSRNQLSGLAIRDGARRIELDIFQESEAVALLRKVTRTGGRRDDSADLRELAELCARLPLALRVAAEHAVSRPTMRLAELITDLRDDSMLWDALSVGEGAHGEAVRTVFAWSYRDLSADAARMFRALGLHRGPDIGLQAAAAAGGLSGRTARRALDILIGAYLVEPTRQGRYQLHDLLRAYALDQARAIDSGDDRRETVDRVLRWYITTTVLACQVLLPGRSFEVDVPAVSGPDQLAFGTPAQALAWFDTERPNLVANALAAVEAGLPRRAWELSMALSPIHANYFTFDDWSVLSEIAVSAAAETGGQELLAAALDNRGRYLFRRRRLRAAREAHRSALSIQQETGDQPGVLRSLNALGLISMHTRDLAEAAEYFTDVAETARGAGATRWEMTALHNLAKALLEAGSAGTAVEIMESAPRYFAGLDDQAAEGNGLWLRSRARRLLGDLEGASRAIDAALRIAEKTGNRTWEGLWLTEAARVHLALGDTDEAMRCCRMAASLQRQIGDHSREAAALDCTGEVLLAMGNAEDAAAFHMEAARMHRQLDDDWQEALAIAHLAGCETALGQHESSRTDAERALVLIQRFTDDGSARMKARLQALLA